MPVTDGTLPRDVIGNLSGSNYVPNTGVVARQGGPVHTDGQNQPYAADVVNVQFNDTAPIPFEGGTLIASAALSATTDSASAANPCYKGIIVYIKTGSQGSGASAIVVAIQGYDQVDNVWYDLLVSASLSASKDPSSDTKNVLVLYPGIAVTANSTASTILPPHYRVEARASAWGTGGSTVGVSCALLP